MFILNFSMGNYPVITPLLPRMTLWHTPCYYSSICASILYKKYATVPWFFNLTKSILLLLASSIGFLPTYLFDRWDSSTPHSFQRCHIYGGPSEAVASKTCPPSCTPV